MTNSGWDTSYFKFDPEVREQVREVGDGNINYVYIVEGPSGGVVVKQGLPYIRIAHDWPLTQVGL